MLFWLRLRFTMPLATIILLSVQGFSQTGGCDGIRYLDDVGTALTINTEVYGQNVNAVGDTQTLRMDIYSLANDTVSMRPAIVLAFGGGFVSGSRDQLDLFCRIYAQKGYIAVTIDYRIWNTAVLGTPDSLDILATAMMAVSDMKAAVRHLKVDAAMDNAYRVNPDQIWVGGVSAGAITALHTGYLTADDTLPVFFEEILSMQGGLTGNTGDSLNMSINASVAGVINMSGAIYDTTWINAGDIPLVSYHGDADEIVPFESGLAAGTNALLGSGLIHQRMEHIGNLHYLRVVPGGGHVNIYIPLPPFLDDLLDFFEQSLALMETVVCPMTSAVDPVQVEQAELRIYPNPARDHVTLTADGQLIHEVRVSDLSGQSWIQQSASSASAYIPLTSLAKGLYVITVRTDSGIRSVKLVVTD